MSKMKKRKITSEEVDGTYITKTSQALVDICLNCPYPRPKCGADGCVHYKQKRQELKV